MGEINKIDQQKRIAESVTAVSNEMKNIIYGATFVPKALNANAKPLDRFGTTNPDSYTKTLMPI